MVLNGKAMNLICMKTSHKAIIKNDKEYILEVDINYPKELQKATKKCKKKDLCVTRKNMSYT